MRWIWFAAVLVSAVLVSVAHADILYLKDGQILWGREIIESEHEVTLIRPTGPVTFPRSQVERFERAQISLPRFYMPPESTAETPAAGPAAPAGAAAAPPAATAAPGAPAEGAGTPLAPPAPSELPPPPPPPPPQ